MIKKILLTVALGLGLAACNADDIPDTGENDYEKNGLFINGHSYISDPIRSCVQFVKCTYRLNFKPDGKGVFITLEQENPITYSIQNGRLTVVLVGTGDIPHKIEFDVVQSAMAVVRRDTHTKFRLHAVAVEIFKPTGERQCEPESGTSLTDSQTALTNAGINITYSNCGELTDIAFPAVCGGGTSSVNIHEIEDIELHRARELGYKLLSESSTAIKKTACLSK